MTATISTDERFRLEALPQPVCILDRDGAALYRNRLCDELAQTATPAFGAVDELNRWIHPDDASKVIAGCQTGSNRFELDCRVHHRHGTFRWYALQVTPYRSASGDTTGWQCIFIEIQERKLREIELERNVEIQAAMLSASIDCIKVITPDGNLSHMNKAGCAALGLPEDSEFGMDWLNLLPEEVRAPGRSALTVATHGTSARFPGSSQLPGAQPQYWDNLLTPLTERTGKVNAVLCVSREVTLQREAEVRLQLAVRAASDAIWDWDLRVDQMSWSDAMERRYGYKPEEIEHTVDWWQSRIHPEDRERVKRSVLDALSGAGDEYTLEYRFARADGRFADVCDRACLSRDLEGRVVRIVGAMLDQTEQKSIERNLQALNRTLEANSIRRAEEFELLWKTSPDILLVVDTDGIIRRANPALREILGYAPSDFIGKRLHEFAVADDMRLVVDYLATATQEPWRSVEIRHRHRDGSCRWIAWAAAPFGSEIYATGRHVTALKEADDALRKTEDALRQAQKMETLGRLTGSVAHDFNNLLAVMQNSVELLKRANLEDHHRQRAIDAISNTTSRAVKLTGQLLAFGRRSSLTPMVFDAASNIYALREMICTLLGPMVRLEITKDDDDCLVNIDPNQFDTAIVNVAVNARDAMHGKGHLKIVIRTAPEIPATSTTRYVRGRFVVVSISDTGSGIPEEAINNIFEPFFTTKARGQGTGLGLSQVLGFIKESGGDVAVASLLGEGATFMLYLPHAQQHGVDIPARPGKHQFRG